MSAAEIIEKIRALPPNEQQKVYRFLKASREPEEPNATVDARFEKTADEVFTENAELFRKLAQ